MTKKEKEDQIMSKIKHVVEMNNEADRDTIDWWEKEEASGTDMENFSKFLYNGYVYYTDIENIISDVMFNKPATIHHSRNHRHGTYDEDNLTEEEQHKVDLVYSSMIKKGLLKPSKSGAMIKVLF